MTLRWLDDGAKRPRKRVPAIQRLDAHFSARQMPSAMSAGDAFSFVVIDDRRRASGMAASRLIYFDEADDVVA